MFRQMPIPSTPEDYETSFNLNPCHPRITRESLAQMESSSKSHKFVDIWFQLFSNILDDDKITKKL
jgi:hypothetical protein